MNVDREVVVDLLPVYFSGEASSQTRALVETHFRQDPDFERSARLGGHSPESLRDTAFSATAEAEKKQLHRARAAARYRLQMKILLLVAVLYTLLSAALIAIEHFHLLLAHSGTISTGAAFAVCTLVLWLTYAFSYLRQRSLK